jgi:hypothetical protein
VPFNRTVELQFCRSPQRFAQNRFLDRELMFVAGVLVMTAPAAREVGASRLDAVRRRFKNAICDRPREPGLLLRQMRLGLLAFQHERNENSLAATLLVGRFRGGKTRQSIATINQLFNREEQEAILNQAIRVRARPLRPRPMPIGS